MKKFINLLIASLSLIFISNVASSQNTINCSSNGESANTSYTLSFRSAPMLFNNAYSLMNILLTPINNTVPAAFVNLPDNLTNDEHIQKTFEQIPSQQGVQTNVAFDIYFPKFRDMNSIALNVYPRGTNPKTINANTPNAVCVISLSATLEASALMLDQEDKERNVRIFQVANATPGNSPQNNLAEYTWTGRNLQSPNDIIPNAVVHLTEEQDSFLLKSLDLQQIINPQNIIINLSVYIDPSNNDKAHIYLNTDVTGVARLRVRPKTTPAGGHLIYWPFADNTSEAARIIVYDPNILANGFFEPIPTKNPVTVSASKSCDIPTFNIRNNNTPSSINEGGTIYLMINDNYDNSIVSTSQSSITMNVSNRFIATSNRDLPQPNNARYVYLSETGNVNVSRKYSFFAYEGRAETLTRLDNTVLNFCDINTNPISRFDNVLSPDNEVPALSKPSNASGRVIANYNAADKVLQWFVTFQNLTATMAHFHGPASPTANAAIIIPIAPEALVSPISGRQILTDQQAEQLLSGQWYFNIHTAQNPNGELRAQLIAN